MKISKTKLQQIIKEELQGGLQANRIFHVKQDTDEEGFVVLTDGTFEVDLLLPDGIQSITIRGQLDARDFKKLAAAHAEVERDVGAAKGNYLGVQEPLDPSSRVDPIRARQRFTSTGPWAPEYRDK